MKSNDNASPTPLIACVDDDISVREALEGLLGAFGFLVVSFASAEAFLASETIRQVSCLITDLQLGGISGLQLQKRLTAMGHRVPAIVITAFSDDELRSEAMAAGAIKVLMKPIRAVQLLAAIRLALGRDQN